MKRTASNRANPAGTPRRESASSSAVARALLDWYTVHRRDLPWRKSRDPYCVWVSEVMLQQTQVATVRGYYERWIRRFPNVQALARATEQDVLHAWQGLGYYSRARNLWRGARTVWDEHGGVVPRSIEALRSIPGIGPYSAGAIASIAYEERTPLVDGNVLRVLCRLFALRGDPTRAPLKNDLWRIAGDLVPVERPGDFNQALMELGATVCTPRTPSCRTCPLCRHCAALRQGSIAELPELPKRAAAVPVARVAAVVRRGDRVLAVRVKHDAPRWAGMWQFPNADIGTGETVEDAARRAVRETVGLQVTPGGIVHRVRHSVTRYRITLNVVPCSAPHGAADTRACAELTWHHVSELDALAMPAAHRRIARWLDST